MKKGTKTAIATICTAMMLLFTGCGGLNVTPNYTTGEYGDFKYRLHEKKKLNSYGKWESIEKFIKLDGLTEEGKKKEIIVVPTEIDGHRIKQLSSGVNFWSTRSEYDFGFLESENLKVIYIPHAEIEIVVNAEETFLDCPNLEKIVYIGTNAYKGGYSVYYNQKIYVPCLNENQISNKRGSCYYANISYFYNYDGAENEGYYWVDYFAYGEKIEYIPEDPTREGYTFGGWYMEELCENKWDFEVNTLPEAKYNEDGDELYQETKLFAKWIKE